MNTENKEIVWWNHNSNNEYVCYDSETCPPEGHTDLIKITSDK